MGKYYSSSNERRLQVYLKPRAFMIIDAERRRFVLRGESEHMQVIIDSHIAGIPKEEQDKLIEEYYEFTNKNKINKQP